MHGRIGQLIALFPRYPVLIAKTYPIPLRFFANNYKKPGCEHFAQYFLWCSVPALRLCSVCLDLPRYKFIRVRDALFTYGLKRGDVASLPKLKSTHLNKLSIDLLYI